MKEIHIPTHCPSCNSALELVNDQLFCRNKQCDAQIAKKLEHFVKVLGIKGLGPVSLGKLQLEGLLDIFYMSSENIEKALGKTISAKIINELESAKNNATLATVIESFGIPLVGGTASTKIASVVKAIDEITAKTCLEAGLGEKVTNNLLNWVNGDYQELKEVMPFKFQAKTTNTAGFPTVCITGKVFSYKTKAEAGKALLDKGYKLVDSVTKTLNYLVDEDAEKNSSKRAKAIQYGVTIIPDLNKFLDQN